MVPEPESKLDRYPDRHRPFRLPKEPCEKCNSTGLVPLGRRPCYGLAVRPCPGCHNDAFVKIALENGVRHAERCLRTFIEEHGLKVVW